jgi:hypothetical protein
MAAEGSIGERIGSFRGRMNGLGLAQGTVTDALIVAMVRAIMFILFPTLLVSLFLLGAGTEQVITGLEEVRHNAVIAGAAVVLISFAWAYHLQTTKARLMFGLTGAVLIVVYGYAVFLTGGFDQAMDGYNWAIPGLLMFGVACYYAMGSAFRFIRDYEFFRKAFQRAKGNAEVKKLTPGMGEFALWLGSNSSAASVAGKFIGKVIIRWSLILLLITWILSLLGLDLTAEGSSYLQILNNMVGIILLLGIPMTALAWFKGFYPKGTISRTVFDVAHSIAFVLLIILVFALSSLPEAAKATGTNFPLLPIVTALGAWAVIDVLRAIGEYGDERRTWKVRQGYEVKSKKHRWHVDHESRLYELSPGIGKISRGLVMAQRTFFVSVTLMEIFIILALGAARAAGIHTGPIYEAMTGIVVTVLIYGTLLTLISFGKGFYPAGSLGRLLIGLLWVPGLYLYMFSTFLTSTVEEACVKAGLIIPFNLVVTLVIVSILFVGLLQFAEYLDARRAWLTSVGKKVRPFKPIKKMSWLQEFRFRFGSTFEGTRWARKGMVRYLYYTTIILIVILTVIESTSFVVAGLDLHKLDTNLRQTYIAIILLAIPLATARAAYGFYPSGSVSKLTFGLVMCLVGAAYTYFGLQGGHLIRGGELENVQAGLIVDFSFIVYAFLIGWGILSLKMLVEFRSYRKEWIANDYRPVTSAEMQAEIKQRKLLEREEQRVRRAQAEGISYEEVVSSEAPDAEGEVAEEIKGEIGRKAMESSMKTMKDA